MDLTTTQRYMHLSPAAIEGAIRLLDQALARCYEACQMRRIQQAVAGSRSADNQDGISRVLHHSFSDAAQYPASNTRATVAAHGDKIIRRLSG